MRALLRIGVCAAVLTAAPAAHAQLPPLPPIVPQPGPTPEPYGTDDGGVYEHSDAIRILDAWWPLWVRAEFEPVLGRSAFDTLTATIAVDDTPNGGAQHHGSAFQGSWYGFVSKDLRTTLGRHVRGRYARRFCGSLRRCRRLLSRSLSSAVKIPASTVYSGDSLCQAGGQVCWDSIRQRPTGGATQPLIEWINRPTFQQAVEVQHLVPR